MMIKHKRSYQREADKYEYIRELQNFLRQNHLLDKGKIADRKKAVRAMAKEHKDRLEKSLSEDWRSWCSEDGESRVEYIIMEDKGETDEQIQEQCDDMEIHNNSMYDCTGKEFTFYIHWKRTPAGIVIVHRKGLDV